MRTASPVPGQFVIAAAVVGFAILFSVAVATLLVVSVRIADWRRRRAAARHDVRLLNDLDKHLNGYVHDNPELKAGLERLLGALRDEQQEGGPA